MNLSDHFKGVSLSDQFIVPPFSVLDARKTEWIKRKRRWLEITGIPGGGPRKIWNQQMTKFKWEYIDEAIKNDPLIYSGLKNRTGKSYFDPVLCEIAYSWFTCKNSIILDPFAGSYISGIVAAKMNRYYSGIELRQNICKENSENAIRLGLKDRVNWIFGDSLIELNNIKECDFIFSCPPYGNLEIYSNNEMDLSNIPHNEFVFKYEKIIKMACHRLRRDRFAGVLVGDFRDKNGFYRNFVSETIRIFESAGLKLYNELILVTSAGSLAGRAAFPFIKTRKIGKTHQNFLVFVNGDPKKATEYCGKIEIQ